MPEIKDKALALYEEGNREGAAGLMRNWLQENPDHQDYLAMAEYLIVFQKNLEDLVAVVNYLVDSQPSLEAKFLFRAAETLELAGDYERSFTYYLNASEKTDVASERIAWMIEAAGISLLMGEMDKGEEIIEQTLLLCESGQTKAEALLLLSRILYYQGKRDNSLTVLQDSLSEKILPESLLWKDYLNQGVDESSTLSTFFPDSLSALLQKGGVREKTEPLYLGLTVPEGFITEKPLMASGNDEEGSISQEKGAIQAGSFVDEENARELQKDLERLGYQTEIRISERNNRIYHRVVIVEIDRTMLREELEKLRDRGYDGFITQ